MFRGWGGAFKERQGRESESQRPEELRRRLLAYSVEAAVIIAALALVVGRGVWGIFLIASLAGVWLSRSHIDRVAGYVAVAVATGLFAAQAFGWWPPLSWQWGDLVYTSPRGMEWALLRTPGWANLVRLLFAPLALWWYYVTTVTAARYLREIAYPESSNIPLRANEVEDVPPRGWVRLRGEDAEERDTGTAFAYVAPPESRGAGTSQRRDVFTLPAEKWQSLLEHAETGGLASREAIQRGTSLSKREAAAWIAANPAAVWTDAAAKNASRFTPEYIDMLRQHVESLTGEET